jgi:hypothetical protein
LEKTVCGCRHIHFFVFQGKDIVRLRFFPNGKGDGIDLIKFLKDNVDVRPPTQDGAVDTDGRPLYYLTGVGIQYYNEKLEEAFSCRQVVIGLSHSEQKMLIFKWRLTKQFAIISAAPVSRICI